MKIVTNVAPDLLRIDDTHLTEFLTFRQFFLRPYREFYYIQMEKYARQSASEGMKNVDDIHVSNDSEIYRVLNLHYNRNNHIEVSGFFVFLKFGDNWPDTDTSPPAIGAPKFPIRR